MHPGRRPGVISMPSAITDCSTSTCSTTECIRRSVARSRWRRPSCTSCTPARRSAGRRIRPAPLIDPAECAGSSRSTRRLGIHLHVGNHVLRPDLPDALRLEPSPRNEAASSARHITESTPAPPPNPSASPTSASPSRWRRGDIEADTRRKLALAKHAVAGAFSVLPASRFPGPGPLTHPIPGPRGGLPRLLAVLRGVFSLPDSSGMSHGAANNRAASATARNRDKEWPTHAPTISGNRSRGESAPWHRNTQSSLLPKWPRTSHQPRWPALC